MMIDMILFVAYAAAFYAGWWSRGKFGSMASMVSAGKAKVRGWL